MIFPHLILPNQLGQKCPFGTVLCDNSVAQTLAQVIKSLFSPSQGDLLQALNFLSQHSIVTFSHSQPWDLSYFASEMERLRLPMGQLWIRYGVDTSSAHEKQE